MDSTKESLHLNGKILPCFEDILKDCVEITELGIRNQYTLALARATELSSVSMYHSLIKTILHCLKVVLTLEKDDIDRGLEEFKQTSDLCEKFRRPHNIASTLWKYLATPNYTNYTEEQLHAELVKSLNHLLFGVLTFFTDQSIVTMVKGAIRLQTGHSLMKSCSNMAEQNIAWPSRTSKLNFMSGVHIGLGLINLTLSHLPDKIMSVLNWAGYSTDRDLANQYLEKCADQPTIYTLPGRIVICLYETLVNNVIGSRKVDINKIAFYADKELDIFNKSAWFLLIKGQLLKFTGELDSAIIYYHMCIDAQDDLVELNHICFWDLCTCHAFKFEWDHAFKYADLLFERTKWSKATFMYMKGALLYMKMIMEDKPMLKPQVTELFRRVPQYKVRFAGKTIPQEKYVCVYVDKYFKQNESLPLPILDTFYIWNIFCLARLNPKLVDPMIELIEKRLKDYPCQTEEAGHHQENYYHLLFFKGVCLKFRRKYSKAEKCFKQILNSENWIKEESHLIPWTMLELGLTKMNAKSVAEAEHLLKRAKNNYSGYLFEMMILMKIHSALQRLKSPEFLEQELEDCI